MHVNRLSMQTIPSPATSKYRSFTRRIQFIGRRNIRRNKTKWRKRRRRREEKKTTNFKTKKEKIYHFCCSLPLAFTASQRIDFQSINTDVAFNEHWILPGLPCFLFLRNLQLHVQLIAFDDSFVRFLKSIRICENNDVISGKTLINRHHSHRFMCVQHNLRTQHFNINNEICADHWPVGRIKRVTKKSKKQKKERTHMRMEHTCQAFFLFVWAITSILKAMCFHFQ